MTQQTAVEWLIEFIQDHCMRIDEKVIEQAKTMEKIQIMKAVDKGYDEGCKFPEDMTLKNSEQYYNETYNK